MIEKESGMQTPLSVLLGEKGSSVIAVAADTSVAECISKMNAERIGALLVTEEGRPVGIFTERDVLSRVVNAARDPETTAVSAVMSHDLFCVEPEATVGEALQIISERRFRHLPVVKDGRVVGVISSGDLNHWLVRNQQQEITHLVNYIAGSY